MRRVYLDHAATTPVDPRVLKKMLPCFSECFANPESQHSFGRAAADAADAARDTIAKAIGAKSSEIYFTSGGTESCNWALRGYMRANAERGRHFIVSAAEHPAVLETAKDLEREGFIITLGTNGRVVTSDLALIEKEKDLQLRGITEAYLARIKSMGFTKNDAADLILHLEEEN